jgi:histone acetyltransferase 1
MIILLRLDPADARAQKAYRLQVKERLYRFNYVSLSCVIGPDLLLTALQEILMQLDKEERFAKLEETFRNVCDDYKRILAMAL